MLLSQIVEVNQTGVPRSSVSFELMNDEEVNRDLCTGFIFNYDPHKPEESTVGILNRLRYSYHNRNEPNIHLVIQQYGKGKSHFAVAIANYFKQPYDSPEVQGILQQVENAVGGKSSGLVEGLHTFKRDQNRRFLVICLSGDQPGDLRKFFLQAVLQALDAETIDDGAIARHICGDPLQYLEKLTPEQRQKADDYLEDIDCSEGDVNSLIRLLRENNASVIRTVKQVAKHITGFVPDFQENIDIEAILKDIIDNLCSGDNAIFKGILILFDELHYYLKLWAADEIGAGGTALQNITNICESRKGKIALLSFTQFDPDKAVDIPANVKKRYSKISTRLAPKDSIYKPVSSLELVIDSLLIQKVNDSKWKTFYQRFESTLFGEARIAYEKHITTYRERGWSLQKFNQHLSIGCFPLHPITAYLLANLSFSQDRSAIQFLRGEVTKIINHQQSEISGKPNYIYPVALVDTFLDNFAAQADYSAYQEAHNATVNTDNPDELVTLKALFLYHSSGGQITKTDRQDHEEILEKLTGLSRPKLKKALDSLVEARQLIYFQPATRTYLFFRGNPVTLEDDINDKVRDKISTVESLVKYSQGKVSRFLNSPILQALEFVRTNRLVIDDWQFIHKFYTIDGLRRALSGHQTMSGINERGILAYVFARTPEELEDFRRTIDQELERSPNGKYIAVAIPTEATGELDRVLLKLTTLESKEPGERRLLGEAYTQLVERWEKQLNITLKRIVQPQSCTFHSVVQSKIPSQERSNPSRVISALLQERYRFVPPVGSVDKMRSGHTTGSKVTGFIAKQLFNGRLGVNSLPNETSYQTILDDVFCRSWGLFRKSSEEYVLQLPQQENVRAAWNLISQTTQLDGQKERTLLVKDLWKTLSKEPYGYNEYTFTVLLASWLAYHRREIYLRGSSVAKPKKNQPAPIVTQSLKAWAGTNILDKPKVFVEDWINKGSSTKLIRKQRLEIPKPPSPSMSFEQAEHYLVQAHSFLESSEADESEIKEVKKTVQATSQELEKVSQWLAPIEKAEALPETASIQELLEVYSTLFQESPTIQMRTDVISVHPTLEQRDRQHNAQEAIRKRLDSHIQILSQRSESLTDLDACTLYKNDVQKVIAQLEQTPHCPPHFVEILQSALQGADKTRQLIEDGNRIQQRLERIRTLVRNLGNYFTQQSYAKTHDEITQLLVEIPADTTEGQEARQILQDLESEYKELIQQIDAWEERETSAASSALMIELIKEISTQRDRFTDPSDSERVKAILDKLEAKLSNVQAQDDAEKLLQQELANVLSIAQQKLQRIRDLPFIKIAEIFQVHQELSEIPFPSNLENTKAVEASRSKLEDFKERGRSLLFSKFQEICDRKIANLKDCQQVGDLLRQSHELVNGIDDLQNIKTDIETAIQTVETRQAEIEQQIRERKQREEDLKLLQAIRQYKADKINTIALCEEGINVIETRQQDFHQFEAYEPEVDQIKQSLRDKISKYENSLSVIQDRLSLIDNLKELEKVQSDYARLELIFQNSSHAETYTDINNQVQSLRSDLEQISKLELGYQKISSITACQELIDQMGDIQVSLHDLEHFQKRLTDLETQINEKKKSYAQRLKQLEQKLELVSTAGEAQEIQLELLQQTQCYVGSDAEAQHQELLAECKLLVEFFNLADIKQPNDFKACQALIQKITAWKETIPNLSQNLTDRVQSLMSELEAQKTSFLKQRKSEAEAWLQALDHDAAEIFRMIDDQQRLEAAIQLQNRIQAERPTHLDFLSAKHRSSVTYIDQQCQAEQQKNQANQIIASFRQLPKLQRQHVYEQLAQYLSDSSESDGGI